MEKFRLLYTLFVFAAVMAFASCGKHVDEPTPEPEKPEMASRTVLVYMVANNSLGVGAYDYQDLKEMELAAQEGQLADGRLVVYHSPRSGETMLKEITATGIDTLKTYGSGISSITIEQMRQVIADTKELAPAQDYGLVLWSHALGWLQDGIADAMPVGMAYSFGLENGRKMNITSLQQAIEDQNFSFVYFDCCFMGSVEVLYQLRNAAPVIAASPAEDPINGLPYNKVVKYMFWPQADMVSVATTTFEHYMETYQRYDCPVTMSVVQTDKLDRLAELTRQIYAGAETSYPDGYSPQKLAEDRLCYYYDFEDYAKAVCADETLLQEWQQALAAAVIYKDNSPWIWGTIALDRYCGLSTYIMQDAEDTGTKGYDQLAWYQDIASVFFNK